MPVPASASAPCPRPDPTRPHRAGAGGDEDPAALFARARAWLHQAGEPGWIADAFGHWVMREIAPHGPVPEPLSRLWSAWVHDPVPRCYRARHGARHAGAAPWQPGEALPSVADAAALPRP